MSPWTCIRVQFYTKGAYTSCMINTPGPTPMTTTTTTTQATTGTHEQTSKASPKRSNAALTRCTCVVGAWLCAPASPVDCPIASLTLCVGCDVFCAIPDVVFATKVVAMCSRRPRFAISALQHVSTSRRNRRHVSRVMARDLFQMSIDRWRKVC